MQLFPTFRAKVFKLEKLYGLTKYKNLEHCGQYLNVHDFSGGESLELLQDFRKICYPKLLNPSRKCVQERKSGDWKDFKDKFHIYEMLL